MNLPTSDRSVALGKRLSSSSNAKSPIGLLTSISNTGLLSQKPTCWTGTASDSYS